MPKGFGAFIVNQWAVLWCGRDLWVLNTTPNKQRAAKPYKRASSGSTEKQTTDLRSNKFNLFLYSCLYFYLLTTILNFSYKVFKSFLTKLVVIYAPSLGRLWAARTFREKKQQQSRVFLDVIFYVYSHVDNKERARAGDWKQRRWISVEDKNQNFIAVVRKWEMISASKVKMSGSEKIKANMNTGNKIFGKHIR